MTDIDWPKLKVLRQSFLDAKGFLPDYWDDESLLHAYEQTLAQRIAWKWDAILDVMEKTSASESIDIPLLIDWGCGSGIATRRVLNSSKLRCEKVIFYDRSARAVQYAQKALKASFPLQAVEGVNRLMPPKVEFALLVSHVLSELPESELVPLLALCQKAKYIFWVEAGRQQEGGRLSEIRESLRATHRFLAPCPHQGPCGMLRVEQARNWCHFFAPIPREVFQSSFWRECARTLGFDLRSLPVSYLLATAASPLGPSKINEPLAAPLGPSKINEPLAAPLGPSKINEPAAAPLDTSQSFSPIRILGRGRAYKGYCRWTGCERQGILERDFQKRNSRELYEQLAQPGLQTLLDAEQLTLS